MKSKSNAAKPAVALKDLKAKKNPKGGEGGAQGTDATAYNNKLKSGAIFQGRGGVVATKARN